MEKTSSLSNKDEEIQSVEAAPAKTFFVEMITRDIELQDAILDLLDNCVDGVRRQISNARGSDAYKGYYAKIQFDKNGFSIEDNCGGIPWEIAKKYAFMMGRPHGQRVEKKGTIGVYGIGMKRAIFKMGKQCTVHSYHKDDNFEVTIAPSWIEDDTDWEIPAKRVDKKLPKYGTKIHISELNEPVVNLFSESSIFVNEFPNIVRDSYSFIINKGFKVTVNGEEIKAKPFELLWDSPGKEPSKSPKIRPYIYEANIDGVDIFLAIGFLGPIPNDEEIERRSKYSSDDAGWTILCNDRVVLSCDKSKITGWGIGGIPRFHTQFISIAGIVEFRSNDAIKLPMTTTKRGVDANSEIFLTVRERMQEGLKKFTDFTNEWKGYENEQKTMFEKASRLEVANIKAVSKKIKFLSIPKSPQEKRSNPDLPAKSKEKTESKIIFTRKVSDIETVSRFLYDAPDRKASEVGAASFDMVLKLARK